MNNQDNDYTGTNFEAIKPKQAQELVDQLPEYTAEDAVLESDHKLGGDLDLFETDEEQTVATEDTDVASEETLPAEVDEDADFDDDFRRARQNIRELEKMRDKVLREAFEVAKTSEAPRAFEVLGDLLDKFGSLGDRAMELHLKKAKIKATKAIASGGGGGAPEIGKGTVRMTTRDLLELIRKDENGTLIDGESRVVDDNA